MTRIEELKQQLNAMKGQQPKDNSVPLGVRVEEKVRMFGINYTKARYEMLIRVEKAKQN